MQKSTPIWKTKDGRKIPFTEMTDSHLNNAIAHCERKVIEKKQQLIEELQGKILDFEGNLEEIRYGIGLMAQLDYDEDSITAGGADSISAAAFAPVYNGRWEAVLDRLEKLNHRLELLKVGDPRGVGGYQELIEERNRRGDKQIPLQANS